MATDFSRSWVCPIFTGGVALLAREMGVCATTTQQSLREHCSRAVAHGPFA